jgi:hypothetical protein
MEHSGNESWNIDTAGVVAVRSPNGNKKLARVPGLPPLVDLAGGLGRR